MWPNSVTADREGPFIHPQPRLCGIHRSTFRPVHASGGANIKSARREETPTETLTVTFALAAAHHTCRTCDGTVFGPAAQHSLHEPRRDRRQCGFLKSRLKDPCLAGSRRSPPSTTNVRIEESN
jgi:hypothetical protein